MATFVCGIGGAPCGDPWVTPAGGVYEKKNIDRWINEHGTDPQTERALSKEDLIKMVQAPGVRPQPPQSMSISSIIKSIRDEYDAMVLANAKMIKDNNGNKDQLRDRLYNQDAAVRVIVRLTQNLANLRMELSQAEKEEQAKAEAVGEAMEAEEAPEDDKHVDNVMQRLKEEGEKLSSARKKRGKKPPAELVDTGTLSNYVVQTNYPGLHSASVPGITCLDTHRRTGIIATGGKDKTVVLFNREHEEIIAQCKGHTKALTAVALHQNGPIAVSGSNDSTIRVWNYEDEEKVRSSKLKIHKDAVTSLSLHPTQDYILSSSNDKSWAFTDIFAERDIVRVYDEDRITAAQFHPDGLILGTGTSRAEVKIWDLKSSSNTDKAKPAASPFKGHSGPVESMCFSENGYHLATASRDNEVRIWDLRKLKLLKTITLSDSFNVRHVTFDQSGTYLSVAGGDVRVFKVKEWNEICRYTAHTDDVTSSSWGVLATELMTCSLDRTVKVFSLEDGQGSKFA